MIYFSLEFLGVVVVMFELDDCVCVVVVFVFVE